MRISDWSSACALPIYVLRIDNVETLPAERITANDEERQRQGFDIQTVFAWPLRDGALDVASALAGDGDGPVLHIDYASGTTISRLNKGLRRRKEKSILGRSEEHTSELQSLMRSSYAVFCLKKKNTKKSTQQPLTSTTITQTKYQ